MKTAALSCFRAPGGVNSSQPTVLPTLRSGLYICILTGGDLGDMLKSSQHTCEAVVGAAGGASCDDSYTLAALGAC